MGREIVSADFSEQDYERFRSQLALETRRLGQWMSQQRFPDRPASVGYELECCLVDRDYRPADANVGFIELLDMPEVVSELARCNVEFNGRAKQLAGDGLERMRSEMEAWLGRGRAVADQLGLKLLMTGVLPTLSESYLTLDHITPSRRYTALNQALARLRGSEQVDMYIAGQDEYRGSYDSIMAESATTSLQLHLRLPPQRAAQWYNAALMASGPVLAMATNSPFLFEYDLWCETRIPIFHQSVDVEGYHFVSFGSRYVEESVLEVFQENLERYPVLLPIACEEGGLEHLLLHNGTIWRWNRIIAALGDDPHLRLEHRSLPSGPSVADMIANCALLYGLIAALGEAAEPPQGRLNFEKVRSNFYNAARYGLDAQLVWFDGKSHPAAQLYRESLLPLAREGLDALKVDAPLAKRCLDTISARAERGLTGAGWQRAWVARHGPDMPALLAAYVERQESGKPVSEWSL